jgi:CO/xanthine dehydrogenase FAD-binding subunit
VIDVFGLPDLLGVERVDGAIRIGAATTYSELLASGLVRSELPALAAAAREVGAVQIQARGTLGGNVGTSSPVGDTLPVLLALDAELELLSVRGARRVPYAAFLKGYRRTALAGDEVIGSIRIPSSTPRRRQYWRKVGTRRAQAISKLMAAAAAQLDASGRIAEPRLAFGAVAERPIRVASAEERLRGERPSPALADEVAAIVRACVQPITDLRSTAEYRRAVAGNLARRWVLELAEYAERP